VTPANLHLEVVTLCPAQLPQSLPNSADTSLSFWIALGICHQHSDTPHTTLLLRTRRERPRRRPAEQRDEVASSCVPTIPVIGFVRGGSADTFAYLVGAFRQGLSDTGYVEGRNVAIEFRWAEGQALKETTRERVPLDWANIQDDLGAALLILGQRDKGTARLADALTAYREALKERKRERVPLDWAGSFGK